MNEEMQKTAAKITNGETTIGIELGSTRIKAVLTDLDGRPIAAGNHDWENDFAEGYWTYSLEAVWEGVQASFKNLSDDVYSSFGVRLTQAGAIGISAMMHGYLAFDAHDRLLVPFRTWRNSTTEPASRRLTELLNYPIPQRWSIAHLYQGILDGEPHLPDVAYLTTLAGYVHWRLTGRKVLGIGDASGMFPIDLETADFNRRLMDLFNREIRPRNLPWRLESLLPKVLKAGEEAGFLTPAGALLLDPSGGLQAGIPFCPPEGDAGTGMVATNSVAPRTGNVSAGTSVFAMIVLEGDLSKAYSEIDLVTTPTGRLVAMVHANNCTSDYDAWLSLFGEVALEFGLEVNKAGLYDTLLRKSLEADPDGGGLLSYGYVSGEHITRVSEGRPLFVRPPGSRFNLANFMRTNLFSSLGALKIGLDILAQNEGVKLDEIHGHGGFFKTREVGQRLMAAAVNVPVSILETAGEGGAWGASILAGYWVKKAQWGTLDEYLEHVVFQNRKKTTVAPNPADVAGFDTFMKRYVAGLPVVQTAVEHLAEQNKTDFGGDYEKD